MVNHDSPIPKENLDSITLTLAYYLYTIDRFLTTHIIRRLPFAEEHLTQGMGSVITKVFVVIALLIVLYESVLSLGIRFKWWSDPTDKLFVKKPVHCAHVYVKVNFVKGTPKDVSYDSFLQKEKLLKKPYKFHLEFGPDDYDYSDPELGCTVGFLIRKLNKLADESAVMKDGLKRQGDGYLFSRGKLRNAGWDDAMCLQQIETGNVVDFFVVVN